MITRISPAACLVLAAVLCGCAASAEPAPGLTEPAPGLTETAAAADTASPTDAQGWLHRLERLARDRQGLDARLRYTTVQGLLNDEQVRYGRLRVSHTGETEVAPGSEAADRFRIDLDGEAVDGTLRKLQRRLVWDGQRLLDADALRREASVRLISGEDELAETLPIPMRVDAEDLLRRYEVTLLPVDETDTTLAGPAVRLRLTQLDDPAADPLEVWFHAETGLPLRGRSGRPGGDTRSVDLVNPQAVDGFDESLFKTDPPRGNGWRVQEAAAAAEPPAAGG